MDKRHLMDFLQSGVRDRTEHFHMLDCKSESETDFTFRQGGEVVTNLELKIKISF